MQQHHLEPLSIFLVKRGGGGDRVLFRYPYSEPLKELDEKASQENNPYALHADLPEDMANLPPVDPDLARLNEKNLISFPSKVLSNLFTASKYLCGQQQKFELKVDDVRFVGQPISLELSERDARLYYPHRKDITSQSLTMFQVVFALSTSATYSVVKCYHDLSHQLAVGIRYEDRRAGYLEKESKIMLDAQDEVASQASNEKLSAFALALERSTLARSLKKVYDDISQTGYVEVRINGWSEILFCLPQKVHKKINPNLLVEPESIMKCMENLRPYHGLLLFHSQQEILQDLPIDYNTAFKKVILEAQPHKGFLVLAADCNLTKRFTFQIGMQLLYWAKATVIYPMCNSNIYVVSPHVPNPLSTVLLDKFAEAFPGLELADFLQLFSLPNSVTQALPNVSRKEEYLNLSKVVVWCLQHHLMIQQHTYITLCLTEECDTELPDPLDRSIPITDDSDDEDFDFGHGGAKKNKEDSGWPPLVTVKERGGLNKRNKRNKVRGKTREELVQVFPRSEDREAVLELEASRDFDDLHMFVRLAPYFNGRYHVEEIMYHENLQRAQILQLVDKFRHVLCRQEHEDTNVTMYFNTSIRNS